MRKGEQWAMPPVDRGPVRALARDYVDSRKVIVSEYILFAVFVLYRRRGPARRGQAVPRWSC